MYRFYGSKLITYTFYIGFMQNICIKLVFAENFTNAIKFGFNCAKDYYFNI